MINKLLVDEQGVTIALKSQVGGEGTPLKDRKLDGLGFNNCLIFM